MRASAHWDAIDAAVKCGDIRALEKHFNRRRIRRQIDATEAFIEANPHVGISNDHNWDGGRFSSRYFKIRGLLGLAARQNHIEVVKWFLSSDRISFMRGVLTRLLIDTPQTAVRLDKPDVLECLLEFTASSALLTETQTQKVFNELPRYLHNDSSPEVIQILLAHGMDVNHWELLYACDRTLTSTQLDFVVAEGSWAVRRPRIPPTPCCSGIFMSMQYALL